MHVTLINNPPAKELHNKKISTSEFKILLSFENIYVFKKHKYIRRPDTPRNKNKSTNSNSTLYVKKSIPPKA